MKAIRVLLGCVFAVVIASPCYAQYPTSTVRIVVPYPAGGAVDALARVLGQRLGAIWGQQVIVDNRAGASTMIGADHVAKSPADGYTLMITAELTLATVPHLYKKSPYDPVKDFAPIAALVSATQALVAHPSLPAKNVGELVKLAKSKPGELSYGSFGTGSTGHLNMEMFQSMTGTRLNHIQYRGAGPALNDLLGGHIGVMFAAVSIVSENVKGGRLTMLGVGSETRHPQFPDVPTIAESGVPGFEAKSWFGMVAPAGTPPAIVAKINSDLRSIFADPEFKKGLDRQGLEPIIGSSADFSRFIQSEGVKWGKVVRDAKVTLEQ